MGYNRRTKANRLRIVIFQLALSRSFAVLIVCFFCLLIGWHNGKFGASLASEGVSADIQPTDIGGDTEQFYLAQVRDAELHGPEIPTLVAYLQNLAGYYQSKGRYADSELAQRRVLTIWEKAPGHNERKVLSCHLDLASLFSCQGKTSQAEKERKIALGYAAELLGPSLSDIDRFARAEEGNKLCSSNPVGAAIDAQSLASAFYKDGDLVTAERLYKYALSTLEKYHGEKSPLLSSSLQGLAVISREQGKSELAADMQKRLDETLYPTMNPPDTANSNALLSASDAALLHPQLTAEDLETLSKLKNVTQAMLVQNDEKLAEPFAKRILELEEKRWGADSPNLVDSMKSLIGIERSLNKLAAAELLCHRCIEIIAKNSGAESEDAASALSELALVFERDGKFAAASKSEKQALEMRLKLLGPDHWSIGESYSRLGNFAAQAREFVEAEEYYKKGIVISEKSDMPGASSALNNLARFYSDRGSYEKSELLYKRVCDLLQKQNGPDDPFLALIVSDMGLLSYRQGKYQEAVDRYTKALAVLDTRSDTRPMTVAILGRAADALAKLNRKEEASKFRAQAKDLENKEHSVP